MSNLFIKVFSDENLKNYVDRTCDSQKAEAPVATEGVSIVDEIIGEKIHVSLTFFLAVVLAAGILLLVIIQTYSKRVKKNFKNGSDDVDPEKSKSRLTSVKDEGLGLLLYYIAYIRLTHTRPIGLPPHTPVAQKICGSTLTHR